MKYIEESSIGQFDEIEKELISELKSLTVGREDNV